jgi:hypothetical protein
MTFLGWWGCSQYSSITSEFNYTFLALALTYLLCVVYWTTQDHVEGYHELSAKTKIFFSTAVGIWDADFYVKVDDDVHVNLGAWLFLWCKYFLLEFFWLGFVYWCMHMTKQECLPLPLLGINRNQELILAAWSQAQFLLTSNVYFYTVTTWIQALDLIEACLNLLYSYRNVKYHEPEYWKFGEEGNKYFRHATGQIYAISKDLATYISINRYV